MPVGKKRQNNTMLYAMVTFVGLFIVATVVAIIFYIKFEEQRTNAIDLQNQTNELATSSELRKIGTVIGAKQRKKSRLGTMVDYVDETTSLITGQIPEDTSAEVKVSTAKRKTKETLALFKEDLGKTSSNATGLIPAMEKLKAMLDDIKNSEIDTKEQLEKLQKRFDDAMTAGAEKEKTLLEEKEKSQQQLNKIREDYNELKTLMEQTTEQQVHNLMTQLDQERARRNKMNKELLKTQAELKLARDRMRRSQEKLQALVPPPDTEVAAYKADGRIILIDDRAKTVHLSLGSSDQVYRGLTFSVYDKNMPIPKSGEGKAEIEVFDVQKNISVARIIHSNIRKPIVLDDTIANLIWDSDKTNVFVVSGEFDIDDDGEIDYGSAKKIKALIEKWGGQVADEVSIDTDFLVLGKTPLVLRKPTFEQMEVDPMAMEKYENSLQRRINHKEARNQAQALSIPVFNAERFLYFIGYKTQATRAGAF